MTPDAIGARPHTLALCVPAFNAERDLRRLLESARRQTVPFDEVLVYDDASTDGTAATALALGARVIRGETTVGCSRGKNALARAARTEWVHFFDADDELLPHFVQTAHRWMRMEPRPDAVLISYQDLDPEGRSLGVRVFADETLRRDPLRATILDQHNNCGVYLRAAFWAAGGFDEDRDVLYNEDDAFHLRLALAGLRFRAEERICAVRYQRPESMSHANPVACLRAKYHVLRKAAAAVPAAYHPVVALRLWRCAGALGSFLDWEYAERCVALAGRLGARGSPEGKAYFRALSWLGPRLALRVRERLIRWLRPELRGGRRSRAAMPAVRGSTGA
jgi:glycosyltransferase involved in cell wall biosynthesis